jgi:predicted nucleotide-binding protein
MGLKNMARKWSGTIEQLRLLLENHFTGGESQINKGDISYCYTTIKGMKINLYSNKTLQLQKENQEEVGKLDSLLLTGECVDTNGKKIFIVHGHDLNAKEALENMLFRWKLDPVAIMDRSGNGQTIIEKLETDTKECSYGIVLLTPDDMGYAIKDGDEAKKCRARQNAILELGMLLAISRGKLIIIRHDSVEIPSDINGVLSYNYKTSVNEVKEKIRKQLKDFGLTIIE